VHHFQRSTRSAISRPGAEGPAGAALCRSSGGGTRGWANLRADPYTVAGAPETCTAIKKYGRESFREWAFEPFAGGTRRNALSDSRGRRRTFLTAVMSSAPASDRRPLPGIRQPIGVRVAARRTISVQPECRASARDFRDAPFVWPPMLTRGRGRDQSQNRSGRLRGLGCAAAPPRPSLLAHKINVLRRRSLAHFLHSACRSRFPTVIGLAIDHALISREQFTDALRPSALVALGISRWILKRRGLFATLLLRTAYQMGVRHPYALCTDTLRACRSHSSTRVQTGRAGWARSNSDVRAVQKLHRLTAPVIPRLNARFALIVFRFRIDSS